MQSFNISADEAGQTIIKYLTRMLKEAPSSLLYKQLRNKNITLNGKKCQGNEKLTAGDEVKIFMADDTILKFRGQAVEDNSDYLKAYHAIGDSVQIVYSDENLLIANKPVGVLSQKSTPGDVSINEWLCYYCLHCEKKPLSGTQSSAFTPSVCNRLDRNTGGLITFGKTLQGSRFLNEVIRNRSVRKFYRTIVKGKIDDALQLKGYLYKDEKTNKVTVSDKTFGDADYIETSFIPLRFSVANNVTELEVELVTGKTHQIRAHLSSIGHPIIGDSKYGDRTFNDRFFKSFKLKHQFLYACRMEFPADCTYEPLAGRNISIDISNLTDPYFH